MSNCKQKIKKYRDALELSKIQWHGLVLGFMKHGNNINVQFHIEYAERNMKRCEIALDDDSESSRKESEELVYPDLLRCRHGLFHTYVKKPDANGDGIRHCHACEEDDDLDNKCDSCWAEG